jgi:hypothetical protein
MNVEKRKQGNENLKATIPNTDYYRSKTTAECGMFQLFGQHCGAVARWRSV